MDRQGFYFLYVNLNSLAELALQQLGAKILAQAPEPDPLENLSDEEREARVLASFENIDLSALDGLGVPSATEAADLDELLPEVPAQMTSEEPVGEELDVERYLARAYSYEERLRGRIDNCYGRADLSGMDAALLQLPKHLSPLTAQLSAAQMEEWLALYEQGHETLGDLTVQIRRLDMGGT